MIKLHFTEARSAPKAHHMMGPQFPQPYPWKKANNRKSGDGSVSSWSFSFFRGREGYFLSPSSHLFNMSGTSLPQILKGDFNIGFLHEGGRVCNYTTVREISVGPVRKYICLSHCPGLLCFSWVCLLFCTCTVTDSAKCSTQCTRRVR